MQDVLVGRAHRMGEQFVAHKTAIDVEILGIGTRPCSGGQADEAA